MPSRRPRISAKARTDAVTARRAQQLSVLRSPISGVVTRMTAVLGASADPAQALVEVADPSALDIVLSLEPDRSGGGASGREVALSAGRAGGEPLGTGTVASSARRSTPRRARVAIRVTMPTTRRPLRIGESVFGEIAVATRAERRRGSGRGARARRRMSFKVFVVDAKRDRASRTR